MTKAILFYRNSLLTKLFMLVILLVGRGNFLSLSAQETLPYEYGFENNNLASEGWTVLNGYNYGTSNYGRTDIYSSANHTGSYGFRFYAFADYNNQILISPQISTSSSAVDVSFYYRSTGTSAAQEFYVGYSTTSAESSSFIWGDKISYKKTDWEEYTSSFPLETKYVAIKYVSDTQYTNFYIDDFSVSISNPYKVPTVFTLSSFSTTSATFSWTAGNEETAWQISYSEDKNFTEGSDEEGVTTKDITTSDLVDGKYTLTGLKEGNSYYAAIRANYDNVHYSEWTDKVSFTPSDERVMDVNNTSTSTNQYIPINGNSVKSNLIRSQFIIPSGKLTDINGRQITKLKFYSSTSSSNYQNWNFNGATFEVYLKEVSGTTYSSTTMSDWGTKVYNSGTLSVNDYAMEISLNTPYNYNGGNLQIGIKQTTKASNVNYFPWVVITGNSQSSRYSNDDGSATYATANPKVTITTVSTNTAPVQIGENGYTTFASRYSLDLTNVNLPSGLKAYKAAIDAENSKVRFTEINQTIPANTGVLLEGTAGQTYAIPVANSGTALDGNDFLVNSTGGTFTADDGYTYFGMKKATSASDALVFATFAPGSVAIPTDKAYLKVLTSSLPATARQLICSFSDETPTGISATQNDREKTINDEFIYNLNGQRVNKPSKGLYIVNGKKVIFK